MDMNSDDNCQPKALAVELASTRRGLYRATQISLAVVMAVGSALIGDATHWASALSEAPGPADQLSPDAEGGLAVVSDTSVSDESSWTAWFGAPARREIRVEVTNLATEPIEIDLGQLAVTGRGEATDLEPLSVSTSVAAGDTAVLAAEFSLPWFAFGQYDIDGQISQDSGLEVHFDSGTSQFPLGLFLAPMTLFGGDLLWRVRRRIRGRIEANAQTPQLEAVDLNAVDETEALESEAPESEVKAEPVPEPETAPENNCEADGADEIHRPYSMPSYSVPLTPLRAIVATEVEAALNESSRRLDDPTVARSDIKAMARVVARDASERISRRLAMTADEQVQVAHQVESTLASAFGADWDDGISSPILDAGPS